jgi:hypothetical protein
VVGSNAPDEAHRSQYDSIDGFARHMRDALRHASFVGFTGTPIEKTDANTRAVFGNYVSVYDIQRAVVDGATVRKNVTIECTPRKNVRAQLRVLVKRILRKHGYPPEFQERLGLKSGPVRERRVLRVHCRRRSPRLARGRALVAPRFSIRRPARFQPAVP